jgi:hypothetical protein
MQRPAVAGVARSENFNALQGAAAKTRIGRKAPYVEYLILGQAERNAAPLRSGAHEKLFRIAGFNARHLEMICDKLFVG